MQTHPAEYKSISNFNFHGQIKMLVEMVSIESMIASVIAICCGLSILLLLSYLLLPNLGKYHFSLVYATYNLSMIQTIRLSATPLFISLMVPAIAGMGYGLIIFYFKWNFLTSTLLKRISLLGIMVTATTLLYIL